MQRRELLIGGTVSLLLASCTQTPPPAAGAAPTSAPPAARTAADGPLTIRLESYNYGSPGLGGKALQTMIDEFQALNPTLRVEGKNTAPTPDGHMKMIVTEQAAGDPPDIAQLGLNSVASARPLGMCNGHLYASPFTFSTPTLFYNADIFRAAGLDPSAPPATWDDVHRFGLQIKARTDKAPLNIAAVGNTGDWIAQSLVSSNGGSLLSPDGLTATFNQPRAIETFQWLQGLVADEIHPPLNSNDATAAFNSGNLPMFLNSTALLYGAEAAANGKFELRTAGEPWLNWSKAKQGVQAENLFVDALQNVVYGGQNAPQTMDAAAGRVSALLADG